MTLSKTGNGKGERDQNERYFLDRSHRLFAKSFHHQNKKFTQLSPRRHCIVSLLCDDAAT